MSFIANFFGNVLYQSGHGFAKGLTDAFGEIQWFDEHNFDRFFGELNRAFENGIREANIQGHTRQIGDAVGNGIAESVSLFWKNIALKATPWVALSGAAVVGTPFLVSYVYYRLKHNIGRPELASEIHYVDLKSRLADWTIRGAGALWRGAKGGLTWGAVGTAGGHVALVLHGISQYSLGNVIREPSWWSSYQDSGIGYIALAGVAYSLATEAFKTARKALAKKDSAIFSEKLTSQINDIIEGTKHVKKEGVYLQNVLLYGPPGTGKTMVSESIAKKSGFNFIKMSGGDLAQYIQRKEHVTELNRLFSTAKSTSSPTIIFIDEAESLAKDRNRMDKAELLELQNAFLNQTGTESKQVMLILATNRLEDLDPAILSRMDHKLHIGPPEATERRQILEKYIAKSFGSKTFFTEDILNWMTSRTDGLTGRALFKLVNILAVKKTIESTLTDEVIKNITRDFIAQERNVGTLHWRQIEHVRDIFQEQMAQITQKIAELFSKLFELREDIVKRLG